MCCLYILPVSIEIQRKIANCENRTAFLFLKVFKLILKSQLKTTCTHAHSLFKPNECRICQLCFPNVFGKCVVHCIYCFIVKRKHFFNYFLLLWQLNQFEVTFYYCNRLFPWIWYLEYCMSFCVKPCPLQHALDSNLNDDNHLICNPFITFWNILFTGRLGWKQSPWLTPQMRVIWCNCTTGETFEGPVCFVTETMMITACSLVNCKQESDHI